MANNDAVRLGTFEISTPTGEPMDAVVRINGRSVQNVQRLALRLDADKMARVDLTMTCDNVTAEGDAEVSYLFGGQRFTAIDIRALYGAELDDIAGRLAKAMGLAG